MKLSKKERIAFVGGGNMAEALIRGLRDAGVAAGSIRVAEPRAQRRRYLAKRYGVRSEASNRDAVANATIVVLAVKPQNMAEVLTELAGVLPRAVLVVSIAAGQATATIERGLGGRTAVVRVMPNTPCLVGQGASVLTAGRHAKKGHLDRARAVFDTVGMTEIAAEEACMDAVTGLSGSGPAYVYRFAEALIAGGVRAGLPAALAQKLAFQTLRGAAEMLLQTGQTPEALREAVSSPGGTTLAGLATMQKGKLLETVRDGVLAATRRSRELGQAARRRS